MKKNVYSMMKNDINDLSCRKSAPENWLLKKPQNGLIDIDKNELNIYRQFTFAAGSDLPGAIPVHHGPGRSNSYRSQLPSHSHLF
jgi:hypothetical protein